MPSIRGFDHARSWGPPQFTVDSNSGTPQGTTAFWGVEVAVQPELMLSALEAMGHGFYASWVNRLSTGEDFTLPADVWEELRQRDKLYYRVHTSSNPSSWEDHAASVTNTEIEHAPSLVVFDLYTLPADPAEQQVLEPPWRAAHNVDAIQRVRDTGAYSVLIHRHQFSPRRPIDPRVVEWVVIATSKHADPQFSTGVVRLDFQTLEVKGEHFFSDAEQPVDAAAAAEIIAAHPPQTLGENWQVSPRALHQVGDFWALSVPAPSPTAHFGGTMLVHARTGRLIYAATTSWQMGEQMVP